MILAIPLLITATVLGTRYLSKRVGRLKLRPQDDAVHAYVARRVNAAMYAPIVSFLYIVSVLNYVTGSPEPGLVLGLLAVLAAGVGTHVYLRGEMDDADPDLLHQARRWLGRPASWVVGASALAAALGSLAPVASHLGPWGPRIFVAICVLDVGIMAGYLWAVLGYLMFSLPYERQSDGGVRYASIRELVSRWSDADDVREDALHEAPQRPRRNTQTT